LKQEKFFMGNNVYKIIGLSVLLVLFAATLWVFRPVSNTRTRITVVGDSEAKLKPDTAVITFSVVTQGKAALDTQQENARKSEAVKTAVETVTGDLKAEIKTSDYNLTPERDYDSDLPKIAGYEVRNTVTVSVKDLDHVGQIIDAATRAGANSVEGIAFVMDEKSPAQGTALSLATEQAMAKAESIAKSLNGHIVRVVSGDEGGVPVRLQSERDYASTNMTANMAKPSYTTPVQAGSLNVRSSVVLVVEIEI
jgi:uncharacterized protein